ncbi:MAG: hypothetical protein WC718_11570 [Phycisphaerales bacterium]|jgi:hypothetical protein
MLTRRQFTRVFCLIRLAFAAVVVSGLGACAQGPTASQIAPWRDAIGAVRDQSDAAFAATNALARDNQIAFAITQPRLNETLFHPALDSESIRAWDASLDVLATYAAGVTTLVDPSGSAATGATAAALAQRISLEARSTVFTQRPGLSSAIAKVGAALAQARASAAARDIVAGADPAVQSLLQAMRDAISQTDAEGTQTGVIAAVQSNWSLRLAEVQVKYLSPGADRAELAAEYADILSRRDAAIVTLSGLQRSIDSLAAAHAQLALGQPVDIPTILAQAREYAAAARDVLADLQPAH